MPPESSDPLTLRMPASAAVAGPADAIGCVPPTDAHGAAPDNAPDTAPDNAADNAPPPPPPAPASRQAPKEQPTDSAAPAPSAATLAADDSDIVLTPQHPGAGPDRVAVPAGLRSPALALIALCAVLAVLHWAAAVFIPIATSALLTCLLAPIVGWLNRRHVPRTAAAALLLLGLVSGIAGTVYALSDDTVEVVNTLPLAASKVRDKWRERSSHPGTIDKVQKAAEQIEQAAAENAAPSVAKRGVQRVQIERTPLNLREYLWTGTMGVMSVLGQIVVVLFLSFFALSAGDNFRRKLMRIAGPSLARRKVTLQVIDEINLQVQRYMLVQVLTSAVVGVATGLAFAALGLDNAAVWAMVAGVLNLVPYIGSVATAAGAALVGFLQFGSLDMAMALAGASLLIHTLVGNLLTPWLTSRASTLSPVAVFVSVLVWGWLWGVWGLLLGIPIMMAVKAVCDRVEDLHAVGELLGN